MPELISNEAPWRRSRVVVAPPNPAAGADWSLAVPAGHVYRLLTVRAQLATSAVVANRVPRLVFGDGNAEYVRVPVSAAQAASLTITYTWVPDAPLVLSGSDALAYLPQLSLGPAWTIGTSTTAIDVGDQWSNVRLHVLDTTVRDGGVDIDAIPEVIVEVIAPSANGAGG